MSSHDPTLIFRYYLPKQSCFTSTLYLILQNVLILIRHTFKRGPLLPFVKIVLFTLYQLKFFCPCCLPHFPHQRHIHFNNRMYHHVPFHLLLVFSINLTLWDEVMLMSSQICLYFIALKPILEKKIVGFCNLPLKCSFLLILYNPF